MSKKLDPIVSEFETEEQAEAYDRWFRKKVQDALEDPQGHVTHEEVVAQMREIIDQAERKLAGKNK